MTKLESALPPDEQQLRPGGMGRGRALIYAIGVTSCRHLPRQRCRCPRRSARRPDRPGGTSRLLPVGGDLGGAPLRTFRQRHGARPGPLSAYARSIMAAATRRARVPEPRSISASAPSPILLALHGRTLIPERPGSRSPMLLPILAAEREHRAASETPGGHRDGMALVLRQRRRSRSSSARKDQIQRERTVRSRPASIIACASRPCAGERSDPLDHRAGAALWKSCR